MGIGAAADADPDRLRSSARPAAPAEGPVGPLEPAAVAELGDRLRDGVRRGVRLRDEVLEVVLATLLAGGHLLLEDRPGVGKTQLARSIAGALAGRFSRVQATVDLLPADVLGAAVWHAESRTFEFHPGPVFANVVLVDELNRATPKTQSGLLEAMQERQVTIDGVSHRLDPPFLVIATQNPSHGFDGTYPLPPAQLDRFLARVSLGYPSADDEEALLRDAPSPVHEPVGSLAELLAAQAGTRAVGTTEALRRYVVALLRATREHPLAEAGASPRSGLQLLDAARARAALHGRGFVLPDDVRALAPATLAHRIAPVAAAAPDAGREVVADVLAAVPAR